MADNMVTLRNVTKKYGKYNALTNINISLERGKIYGLIGKNGAGKTTMMRIIAGLSFLSDGEAEVNAKKIGTLIEAPSLNMNMTAKQNIKFYRMLTGEGDDTTDEDILSMVGLEDTGKRKVKDLLKSKNASVKRFARFEKGEGLEKREENFAEEVAKQING